MRAGTAASSRSTARTAAAGAAGRATPASAAGRHEQQRRRAASSRRAERACREAAPSEAQCAGPGHRRRGGSVGQVAEVERVAVALRPIEARADAVAEIAWASAVPAVRPVARRRRRRPSMPEPSRICGRRQHASSPASPPRRRRSACTRRRQHVHEQAGERQVRPVGIGGHVEQHELARAMAWRR